MPAGACARRSSPGSTVRYAGASGPVRRPRSGADGAAGFSSAKRGSAESARGMNNDARRSPGESARQTLRAVLHAAARDRRYAGYLRHCRRSDHDKVVYQPIRSRGREAVIGSYFETRSSEISLPIALNAARSSVSVPGAKYLSLSEAQLSSKVSAPAWSPGI